MISYEDALNQVLEAAPFLETEIVPLERLLGRTLAEPVLSPFDLPLFDNSAVDGYGVIAQDLQQATEEHPVTLKHQGTIPAGSPVDIPIESGLAVKMLTGAPIPTGVEAVVMKEFTESSNGTVQMLRSVKMGENIRRRGEEFKQGETVLPVGVKVSPPVLGLLASLGYSRFSAYCLPKVAVVVTGSELVKPGSSLKMGQIYESNSYALQGALKTLGIEDVQVYWAEDDRDTLTETLAKALEGSDVVITSGGVSVGEYDLVKSVLSDLKVVSQFWKVAIKPGKPVYFGTLPDKLIFGLPGNPVAVLLTFHLLVRPALLQMMGQTHQSNIKFKAKLSKDIRKKPGRLEFVRGVLSASQGNLLVTPTLGQGSHMLGGLAQANCLVNFPLDVDRLSAGDMVDIELLQWSV